MLIFQCTQLVEFARDAYADNGSSLLGSIAVVHPFIISSLMHKTRDNIGAAGEVRMFASMLVYLYVCVLVWTCICVSMYMYVYVCLCSCIHRLGKIVKNKPLFTKITSIDVLPFKN